MAEFPYTTVAGKLPTFFQKIQSIGVPPSVDNKWMTSIGFKSSNDRSILPVARLIGFIDASNKPTSRWSSYRDKSRAKSIMTQGIREGYSDLFSVYPDAYARSDGELKNFFASRSTAGEQSISKTLSTFKTLCSLADFSKDEIASNAAEIVVDLENAVKPSTLLPSSQNVSNKPSLHIDIQIHIDSDATPEQINQIFESMAKHLYKNNGG